jgi:transcriptional regulator with GAF, ATPase, and Fis domain
VIERAVILSRGDRPSLDLGIGPARPSRVLVHHDESPAVLTESDLRHLERSNLEAALRDAKGRVCGRGGAALLGLPPRTFTDRIRRFGIDARQWCRGADDGPKHR